MKLASMCFCLILSLFLAFPSHAGVPAIQPQLHHWLKSPPLRQVLSHGRYLERRAGPALAPVSIRLRTPGDLGRLTRLEGDELRLRRGRMGRPLVLGTVVCALVSAEGLERLSRQPFVERVELDPYAPPAPPLAQSALEVGAGALWSWLPDGQLPFRGRGVRVADIDAHIDVMHPAFFFPDGGYHAWLDVDGDGLLSPGVDGVDLDGDGLLDDGEVLAFFDAPAYSLDDDQPWPDSIDGAYDPGWDYLYLDSNGNGRRDGGPGAFFDDGDPAFGETLFLADDVDGDGQLAPEEKLVALGTSKIRAAFDGQNLYTRGENLSALQPQAAAWHGTCVNGILLGGSPGLTRLVGVAPEAELLMGVDSVSFSFGTLTALLAWAVDEGADVVLQEFALYAGVPLDGSSNYEAAMDAAAAAGVVMINPAGNPAGNGKHAEAHLPPQGSLELPLAYPPSPMGLDTSVIKLSIHWRDPSRRVAFRIRNPAGQELDLGEDGGVIFSFEDGVTKARASQDETDRGTAMFHVDVYGVADGALAPIPNGEWTLLLQDLSETEPGQEDLPLFVYAQDNYSHWGLGVNFPDHASDAHLVGWPATADSATTVAAYAAHSGGVWETPETNGTYRPGEEEQGALRDYSGRGLRIDGEAIMDLAAPDNPLTPMARENEQGAELGLGAVMVFGGTSGAGPHVAGAAALLKQRWPELDGLQVRERLRQAARVDEQVLGDGLHGPEHLWGAGKLDIAQALLDESNEPPHLQLPALQIEPGEPVLLGEGVQDAEDMISDLRIRLDADYDGNWDTAWAPADEPLALDTSGTGVRIIKVQVMDRGGQSAQALLRLEVAESEDGGCACANAARPGAGFLLLVALGLTLLRRRRSRRIAESWPGGSSSNPGRRCGPCGTAWTGTAPPWSSSAPPAPGAGRPPGACPTATTRRPGRS